MTLEPASNSTQTTARGRVREDVRKMILTGELKPGTRLTQQHLAKKFGVAQSVVRESLQGIAGERARSLRPSNLGIFVSDLDTSTLAACIATCCESNRRDWRRSTSARGERASRVDIREMYEMADRVHETALAGKLDERGVYDRRSPSTRTILISGNPLLLNLTESYQMLNMVVQVPRDHDLILKQHRGIVDAIEKEDGKRGRADAQGSMSRAPRWRSGKRSPRGPFSRIGRWNKSASAGGYGLVSLSR